MTNISPDKSTLKEGRKEQIINCALKVFCEKGYDNTTVDDIAKKAKMSHGLFYHYFKSKKSVFESVMKSHKDILTNQMLERLNKEPSSLKKIAIITEKMFQDLVDNENSAYYFYLFVNECFAHRDKKRKPKKDSDCENKRPPHPFMLFDAIFTEGQQNGEIIDKYSPRDCTILLMSIIQGATLHYIIAPKEIRSKTKLPKVEFVTEIFKKDK